MISYDKDTLSSYLEHLALREPVPGGGSAAALASAMGAALIAMSTRYSIGKSKPKPIETRFSKIIGDADAARANLLTLVSEDSTAYLNMVAARKSGDQKVSAQAKRAAIRVPKDIIKISQSLLKVIPFLKKEGNTYMVSDVKAAEGFLKAGISAALAMVQANQ
ncbi:MAG: cyclodeaminase/cyclohydrolase family protein [Candidatus Omnitrophica bacterium]|nr:cyclodeaminase/cyclohydrolase family protein [Candidatus Omnitrophota bacterium]